MQSVRWPFHVFSLFLLFLTGSGAETLLTIHHPSSGIHDHDYPLAVSVSNQDLHEVASSILMAETWLRIHVLALYPSSKITHIVVGHSLLCSSQPHHFHLILPTLNNLHHCLTRWGLQREIKVSPSLSSHCLTPNLSLSLIKPILDFIHATNSTYLANPLLQPISDLPETEALLSPHLESLKNLGISAPERMSLVMETLKEGKPTMRKLSFVIPPLPTPTPPLPEISPAQNFPSPLPPLVGSISFPPMPSSAPHLSMAPSPSHPQHHLPPCNPWAAAPPTVEEGEKLWCVAKPSVPAETLQEAMDYACGEGGADCEEIQSNGKCYYPETLVAHASFAFNSYWQKTKRQGGTCSFGGTAMLINSDPSYLHCRFILS